MRNRSSTMAALVALAANVFFGVVGAAVVEVRLGATIERTWEQGELGLAKSAVAGVEHSEDGEQWKTIREIKGAEHEGAVIVGPLVKEFNSTDLNTDTLYLRCYSRDPQNPQGLVPGAMLGVKP